MPHIGDPATADGAASAPISADGFKITIIIITVFIKEAYTPKKSCRKWSLTVCMELQRDGDTFG